MKYLLIPFIALALCPPAVAYDREHSEFNFLRGRVDAVCEVFYKQQITQSQLGDYFSLFWGDYLGDRGRLMLPSPPPPEFNSERIGKYLDQRDVACAKYWRRYTQETSFY